MDIQDRYGGKGVLSKIISNKDDKDKDIKDIKPMVDPLHLDDTANAMWSGKYYDED